MVTEVNQSGFLKEAPPIEVQLPAHVVSAADDLTMTDTAEFVDVMVLYTQTAMTTSGGATAIAEPDQSRGERDQYFVRQQRESLHDCGL